MDRKKHIGIIDSILLCTLVIGLFFIISKMCVENRNEHIEQELIDRNFPPEFRAHQYLPEHDYWISSSGWFYDLASVSDVDEEDLRELMNNVIAQKGEPSNISKDSLKSLEQFKMFADSSGYRDFDYVWEDNDGWYVLGHLLRDDDPYFEMSKVRYMYLAFIYKDALNILKE